MRKLVLFAAPFAAAVLVYVYALSLLAGLICAGVAAVALAVVLLGKRKQRQRPAIALSGLCIGFLFCALYGQLFLQPVQQADGQTVTMTVELCGYPEPARYGDSVEAYGTVNGRRAKILVYLDGDAGDLRPGDRITLTLSLRRADRNSEGEEYFYYQVKGISLIGSAKGAPFVARCEKIPLRYSPQLFSHRLRQLLADAVPEDAAGLLQVFLTGDRTGLSYAQKSDFQMAGVSHMIAISGMHVSILLAFLSFLLGNRRTLLALLGIPVVLLFVFATGCSPSAVRAALMQLLFLLAPLLGRDNDAPTSLCAALLLLLLQNPYAIANLSLQLSFGSMAGIVWVTRTIYGWLTRPKIMQTWLAHDDLRKPRMLRLALFARRVLMKGVHVSISTTLGAQLFTLPICAISLGSFSIYTLLSNLLILWAVSLSFWGALLTALLGWIWLPLGSIAGWLTAWPVRYILLMSRLIARLPFALLPTDSPFPVIFLIVSYLILGLAIGCRKVLLPTLGIVGALMLTVTLTTLDARPDVFRITAFDVGQGQSVCMLTKDFSALYDCGGTGNDTAGQKAAEKLLLAGVQRLDAVVLSHYDIDHVGGLAQLMYRIDVDTLYLPPPMEDDAECETFLSLASQYGVEVVYVEEETVLPFANGSLTVFPPVSTESSNAGSLCILYSCAGYDMLATGDMDELAERLFLFERTLPQVELYIAGHHGSKHSSSETLLDVIRPETVIVSVGNNRYGHPSQEALARFAAVGATVRRTDECGDITIRR